MCAESANLTGDKRDKSIKITKSAKTVAKDNIIEVKHYKMVFADKTVIKDLSFEVKKGEVFGLLGSNGSGKTTTIRTLLGLYQATDGKLLINGKPFSPEDNIRVGYLPEERGLYKKESVIDTMIYFARLKGIKNPREWSMNFLSRVGLEDSAKTRIDKLSQGMQQKVQLGITVMNEPELLILDEPTKGFDPVNRKILMEIIEELHKKGSTIILITHYMNEVENLCDRILLLKDGKAAAYGKIDEVKKQFKLSSLEDIFVQVYGAKEEA